MPLNRDHQISMSYRHRGNGRATGSSVRLSHSNADFSSAFRLEGFDPIYSSIKDCISLLLENIATSGSHFSGIKKGKTRMQLKPECSAIQLSVSL